MQEKVIYLIQIIIGIQAIKKELILIKSDLGKKTYDLQDQ